MLSKAECEEVRAHLERAHNPVFYYDNDADGLCSFLLFARFLGRGKGVAVRSYPDLHASYARKARELGADSVFILDKPVLNPAFIAGLRELALPIFWIDHHDVSAAAACSGGMPDVTVYNPLVGKPSSSEPVTYWAQRACMRKEDLWIAMMGCIADHYLPDFSKDFAHRYPELWGKDIRQPFDAYFQTEIGALARALNFGLKDSVTHVVALQEHLLSCRTPGEVLADVAGNRDFRRLYEKLMQRYQRLLQEALQCREGKMVFFSYGGETSMSSELANELAYRLPDGYVAVAYTNAGITNVSLRGKSVKLILERILPTLTHATGGGHRDAVGARIASSELALFKERFMEAEHEAG